jgi:hypothetical protein
LFILAGRRADGTPVLAEQILDGSPPRALPGRCAGTFVLVSPDGSLVVCAVEAGLAIHPRDLSPSREIRTSQPVGTLIRWSADGQAVFSFHEGHMLGTILRTDLATGRVEEFRRLRPLDPAGVWRVQPVAVTPDGGRWSYTASRWLGDLYVYSGLR